jgi:Raf kinase inhibitor-like YbhB/YbcL family protein
MFKLTSSAFNNQGDIPKQFSCQGAGISPPLMWSGAPLKTKSYALIIVDYDAQASVGFPVIHCVAYNIASGNDKLDVGEVADIAMGLNSYGDACYVGMNPPPGQAHQYFFYLYALDVERLEVSDCPAALQLAKAMSGHVLDQAVLVANYQRQKPLVALSAINHLLLKRPKK